jgi:protein-S-isoprenylcysteine O-methyltransferase Ste14
MTATLAKSIFVALCLAWYALRIPHQRKARKTPISLDALDRRERLRLGISLSGLGLIPLLYVATGFPAFANRPFIPALAWLGAVLAIAALVMFRLTHKALGRYWSVSLQMREGHKLISEGVYARIRHPMYSAFWLWALAQALLLPNWIAGLSGIIGFGTLYALRVGPEEEMLLREFGDDYRHYMARTGRLWPKLF